MGNVGGTSIEKLEGVKLKVNVELDVVERLGEAHGFRFVDRLWDLAD